MGVQIIVSFNRFAQIAGELQPRAVKIAQEYADGDLKPKAAELAHKDTGALSESGVTTNTGDGAVVNFSGGAASGWGGDVRTYAAANEYGTRFMAAIPFFVPAADATFPERVYARAGELVD